MHWEYFRVLLEVKFSDSNFVFRHFMEVAEFLDSALSQNGKCFVNCVFGRSRSEPVHSIEHMTKFLAAGPQPAWLFISCSNMTGVLWRLSNT